MIDVIKRLIRAAAATTAAVLFLSGFCMAAPEISAKKAILMDASSGRILYEKQAEERSLIASTTKIMTALLVCERCNLADRVRIPRDAVGIEGSSMYLQEGEILSVQDLLYGLMLHSGNDAAVALAIYCAGTESDFVTMMNDKAEDLGLHNTRYANPNGLDHDANFSTAHDLAKLTAYAMENEAFYHTVSCKTVTVGNRSLRNHNKLLFRYDGAVGVKTGYTKAAGRILVSAAERDGRRLIAVTITDPNDWDDHAALLDYGFSRYHSAELISENSKLGTVPVVGGVGKHVAVAAAESFIFPMAENEAYAVDLQIPEFVFAPVEAGDYAGTASVRIGNAVVGTVPLYYLEHVSRTEPVKGFLAHLFGG